MVRTEAAARLRVNKDIVLKAVRVEAMTRLWHLDRALWSRKGAVRKCISGTLDSLCAWMERPETVEGETSSSPNELHACVQDWSKFELSWPDAKLLIDIVINKSNEALSVDRNEGAGWIVDAGLNSLKSELAGSYLRRQVEETERQRDDSVATHHLAGRFLANASHELRTPLTAVLGFSELLLEETYGELSADQKTAIGHIENSAQNLLEIVNNLLDLMQFRAGKLTLLYRRMAVEPVLRNIFQILLPLAKRRKVQFRETLSESLGSIEADEGIVRHIVYHLLESALRATPPDGEVILSAQQTDGELTVITYDTALHFPAAAIENMNDAYPILENSPARGYEGWEIGLPLVRRYVDLHGGTLDIESSPATGTTIRVHIPTHPGAVNSKRQATTAAG